MPKSPSGPLRRGQLIAPFGVGALVIVPGGTSVIVGGLDYWYDRRDPKAKLDEEEYKFQEWRLQNLLNVDHFRMPPDYRDPIRQASKQNLGLTIPTFRFPSWHFCSECRVLLSMPMYASGKGGKLKCTECEKNKKTRYLFQVPFVAMCANGHLQDFPWREWVHREKRPSCDKKLRLISTGSATLAGQKVKCDCGQERSLAGITTANPSGMTTLSKDLCASDDEFLCQGSKPWLGEGQNEECNSPIRGSLRSAANLYFAKVESSIYLPLAERADLQELENILLRPPASTNLSILRDAKDATTGEMLQLLRKRVPQSVAAYSDQDICTTLENIYNPRESVSVASHQDDAKTAFRREEYAALRVSRDEEFLKSKEEPIAQFSNDLSKYFDRIMLVSRLKETRALAGFTRVFSETDQPAEVKQRFLWKSMPEYGRWLPAYTVFGEGIFFEFSSRRLQEWEQRTDVIKRIAPLAIRNKEMLEKRHFPDRPLTPRFVLLHTFAHLVMNRLTFECGYSSAALRERLYVSASIEAPIAGVLIYTADGDSEGTMGGLVRMGRPGNLEPVLVRAIDHAKWCSADPVCMELGTKSGQGPDSCNLAACHNCALVPETACEEFNRFLDRGTLIGDFEQTMAGYFDF